jgi:hypothetical protein
MTAPGAYLRVLIPVDDWTPEQRSRAIAVANRVEETVAAMLASGVNPDRLIARAERLFPDGDQ